MEIENYFLDSVSLYQETEYLVLVIYDIVENKKRVKLAKLLESYGFRVQKSAFEGSLKKSKYEKLIKDLTNFKKGPEDSVRVYKIKGKSEVVVFGQDTPINEDVIII